MWWACCLVSSSLGHHASVQLIPTPKAATFTDADVADVLGRAVAIIDPLIDVLWWTDPLGLKGRTQHKSAGTGVLAKVADTAACVLNTAEVPGTQAWEDLDTESRIHWWVRRVGALNTLAVAFPGVWGALSDRLPIQDVLGFTNQAVVLCAVARERGVCDHRQQVRMLAAVLCHRELPPEGVKTDAEPDADPPHIPRSLPGIAQALWGLMGLLRGVSDELARRPHPRAIFRFLGMVPGLGAVVDYVGEYGALMRAAKAGDDWIARQVSV